MPFTSPNTRTVADLITYAKNLADMTGSSFPDDGATAGARMIDYANDALADLHEILVESFEEYMLSKVDISVVAGTNEYDLPDGALYSAKPAFLKAVRVYLVDNSRLYEIPKINFSELDGMKTSPISSATIQLWYTPQMSRFTATTDTVGSKLTWLPRGGEDFIAYHMAASLLAREESDPSFVLQERERVKRRIIAQSENRDRTNKRVIDKHRWRRRTIYDVSNRSFVYMIRGDVIAIYEVDEDVTLG
jgi:hypothetical protein